MKYFRERHNLRAEYSGFQEASEALRDRLSTVVSRYVGSYRGVYLGGITISLEELEHELNLYLNRGDIRSIIAEGSYDYIFEAIEIFLAICFKRSRSCSEIISDIKKAFDLSGSVYYINNSGEVCLRTEEKLAKDLEKTKEILSETPSAYRIFFDAVGNLFGRKRKPADIIKDIFVAFEDYLKHLTNSKDYGKALSELQNKEVIVSVQKNILEKVYGYRSDAYAVGHAGKTKEPEEIDALWFLETVIAQLNLIDRRKDKLTSF